MTEEDRDEPEVLLYGKLPLKRVLSIDEFCAEYGIGRTKAYEEILSGRLKARRAGGRTIISRDDAEAWLASLPPLAPKK